MRIGEINQNNYKQFLALLGAKSNTALDKLMGEGENGKELTEEEVIAKMYAEMGIEEGMVTKEGDPCWRKIVPVSDEVREKIIQTVRRQFLETGNGMPKPADSVDGMAVGKIMKEYRKNIPPSERLAVTWTLSQIETNEIQRLTDYIKKNVPGWNPGQPFDRNILRDSNFGTISKDQVDVKA
ncbi:MAG: DUF3879 family protein [Treponema sp.]|jgi:hypothetical protein|nr:DUF3879 family protein [Treponema sp.]